MPQVRCKICNKEFYGKPSHIKRGWAKFCSKKCQNKSQTKGRHVKCEECEKSIWRMPKELKKSKSGRFFCSRSCRTIWNNRLSSGEKHPNWRGGRYIDYKNMLVQSNVKRICKLCRTSDKRLLIAHHKDRNRKNHDIGNLVWLCHNCHHLVHNYNLKIK